MTKRMDIVEGPDRFELLNKFGLRERVEFKTTGGMMGLIVDKITHEDGSGHSFILEGNLPDDPFGVVEIYYNERRHTGSAKIMV